MTVPRSPISVRFPTNTPSRDGGVDALPRRVRKTLGLQQWPSQREAMHHEGLPQRMLGTQSGRRRGVDDRVDVLRCEPDAET